MAKSIDSLIEAYENDGSVFNPSEITLRQAMLMLTQCMYDRQYDYNFNDDCVNVIDTD